MMRAWLALGALLLVIQGCMGVKRVEVSSVRNLQIELSQLNASSEETRLVAVDDLVDFTSDSFLWKYQAIVKPGVNVSIVCEHVDGRRCNWAGGLSIVVAPGGTLRELSGFQFSKNYAGSPSPVNPLPSSTMLPLIHVERDGVIHEIKDCRFYGGALSSGVKLFYGNETDTPWYPQPSFQGFSFASTGPMARPPNSTVMMRWKEQPVAINSLPPLVAEEPTGAVINIVGAVKSISGCVFEGVTTSSTVETQDKIEAVVQSGVSLIMDKNRREGNELNLIENCQFLDCGAHTMISFTGWKAPIPTFCFTPPCVSDDGQFNYTSRSKLSIRDLVISFSPGTRYLGEDGRFQTKPYVLTIPSESSILKFQDLNPSTGLDLEISGLTVSNLYAPQLGHVVEVTRVACSSFLFRDVMFRMVDIGKSVVWLYGLSGYDRSFVLDTFIVENVVLDNVVLDFLTAEGFIRTRNIRSENALVRGVKFINQPVLRFPHYADYAMLEMSDFGIKQNLIVTDCSFEGLGDLFSGYHLLLYNVELLQNGAQVKIERNSFSGTSIWATIWLDGIGVPRSVDRSNGLPKETSVIVANNTFDNVNNGVYFEDGIGGDNKTAEVRDNLFTNYIVSGRADLIGDRRNDDELNIQRGPGWLSLYECEDDGARLVVEDNSVFFKDVDLLDPDTLNSTRIVSYDDTSSLELGEFFNIIHLEEMDLDDIEPKDFQVHINNNEFALTKYGSTDDIMEEIVSKGHGSFGPNQLSKPPPSAAPPAAVSEQAEGLDSTTLGAIIGGSVLVSAAAVLTVLVVLKKHKSTPHESQAIAAKVESPMP